MRMRDKTLTLCWIYAYDSNGRKLFSKFYETIKRSSANRVMNRVSKLNRRKIWDSGDYKTKVYGGWNALPGAFEKYVESEENPDYFVSRIGFA